MTKNLLFDMFLFIVTFSFLFFSIISQNYRLSVIIIACIHLFYGLSIYLRHGGKYATCFSVFSLSTVIFLSIPAIHLGLIQKIEFTLYHTIATTMSLISLIMINMIGGSNISVKKKYTNLNQIVLKTIDKTALNFILFLGISFFLITILINYIPISELKVFNLHTLFISIGCFYLLCILSFSFKKNILLTLISFILFILSLNYYLFFVMGNFGRIRIVTLGYILLIISSIFLRIKHIKVLPLIAAPFFLVWAATIRGAEDIHGIIYNADGITSILSPYTSLVKALSDFRYVSEKFMLGTSYLNNIIMLIPRRLWANKPKGLGAIYTEWFSPHLVSVGHSWSPSYLGESYVNWYYFGFFIISILLGLIMRFVDLKFIESICKSSSKQLIITKFMILVMIISGMFDYVWGSSNTFFQRAGIRIFFLILLYLFFKFLQSIFRNKNNSI